MALVLQAVLQANRGASTYTLILVGVSINAFAGAIISMLVANAHDDALARGAVFWLAGDLELRTWDHAAMAAVPVGVGLLLLLTRVRALDALLLGDDVAATSGYDVHRTRLVLLLIASLVTGAAVAVSGVISFVGLVVPHAVRLVVGAKHALLLPLSVVCGALFLVLADTLARAVSVTAVVQTGAVCAVVGAPVFLALLPFVVLAAWTFAESARRPEMPTTLVAIALLGVSVAPLVMQPDFGQSVLLVLIWCALFFLSGLAWKWALGLISTGVGAVFAAYQLIPHVTDRIRLHLSVPAEHVDDHGVVERRRAGVGERDRVVDRVAGRRGLRTCLGHREFGYRLHVADDADLRNIAVNADHVVIESDEVREER